MTDYSVSQLAKMACVSVRTLHHYDQIGLLKPTSRTSAGYRLYVERDLLRLQQILFFKELDLPLEEIRRILDDPAFDQLAALRHHRRMVEQEIERMTSLLLTIDKTMASLTEDEQEMPLTDEELYEGFSKEKIERWKREAREQYDPALMAEANRRVSEMSKERWKAIQAEGDKVTRALAELMDRSPDAPEVQDLIAQHHAWVEHFYTAPAELYRGLGEGYAQNPEFRAFYDKHRIGLADFMKDAMAHYAEHVLKGT